jgi:hypothetical protein
MKGEDGMALTKACREVKEALLKQAPLCFIIISVIKTYEKGGVCNG